MADKRIKVVLLEGEFAALSAVSFPDFCLQLQESGLREREWLSERGEGVGQRYLEHGNSKPSLKG